MKSVTLCLTLLLTLVNAKSKSPKYKLPGNIEDYEKIKSDCWSYVIFGKPCCPEGTEANYFDEYGDWYKDDVTECGIIDGFCWTLPMNKKGENYLCCKDSTEVKYWSADGEWGVEDGEWCGIRHKKYEWYDSDNIEETKEEWINFKVKWENERYNFERISVFVGDDETKINFAWYSKESYTPMIRISNNKSMKNAKTYKGTSDYQFERLFNNTKGQYANEEITIGGETYYTNRVTVKNIERDTTYYYQRFIHGKWEPTVKYKTYGAKNFQFIFVGDPQIGGSRDRYRSYPNFLRTTSDDDGNRNDVFHWDRTVTQAMKFADTPSVLLSAGDQADEMGGLDCIVNQESEYSGLLYPEKLKHIVMATSVGNHEVATNSFGRHFNVPNPLTDSAITRSSEGWYAGYNYFFKYNNVLVVVLETNYNDESDYRITVRNAILKYPETDWRIALFHHDIFGNGKTHSQKDNDVLNRRSVIFNVLSKYGFDVVINGHDHVYTASKFVTFGNKNVTDLYSYKNYSVKDIKANEVIENPDGTFFITANCSSGSKYLGFDTAELDYVNYFQQKNTTSFGILDFSQDNGKAKLKITTYEAETSNVIDGTYIFEKDVGSNVDKCWSEKARGLSCCPPGTKPVLKEDGKLYGFDRNNHCGIVDMELLKEDECWAKKYGKDCCILPETFTEVTDERGQWGVEFGEECGIIEGYNNKCWAEEFGSKCCTKSNTKIRSTDENGNKWGKEDGEKCGIIERIDDCWAERLGYSCCNDPFIKVSSVDENGQWGIEDGIWCGIKKKHSFDVIKFYNAYEPDPIDYEDPPSDCWSERLGYECCADPNAKVHYHDSTGKYGYENNQWCGIIDEEQNSTSVEPDLTTMVEPISTITESSTIVEPTTTIVEPSFTIVEPTTIIVEPTTTIVEPTTIIVEPTTIIVEPTSTIVEPTSTIVEPIETDVPSVPVQPNECLAEYYIGYPCCTPGTVPNYIDEDGSWYFEDGNEWCIVELSDKYPKQLPTTTVVEPEPTTTIVEPEPTVITDICTIQKCCTYATDAIMQDADGAWAIENDEWCIVKNPTSVCWAIFYGYKCCSDPNTPVFDNTDGNLWGFENGEWCGIVPPTTTTTTTISPSSITTPSPSTTTTTITTTPSPSTTTTTTTTTRTTTRTTTITTTTTTTTTNTTTTTTTTQTPQHTNCAKAYERCGGLDFETKCCEPGTHCEVLNAHYHQCVPDNYY